MSQIVPLEYERARTGTRWTKKDPMKKKRYSPAAPSPNLSIFDFCRSFHRHSKPGVCFLPGIYVSKDTHMVSDHHFDDLANGARFKKRHCWGVRIWFDQPRKER